MSTPSSDIRAARRERPAVPVGHWHVDPVRSHASFTARVAGSQVRGHLPLTGTVTVRTRFEDSTALLTALASEVSTGNRLLDRVLAGPGFLETDSYPTISLRSQSLVRLPAGWRSVGQLEVKGVPRPIACELAPDLRGAQPGAAIALRTCWMLESTWITPQRLPMLNRRVAMTCSIVLNRATESTASGAAPAA